MKIIQNKLLPFQDFAAINLFGIIFTRFDTLPDRTLRHEAIHTVQIREMLYIFFYIWYAAEWIVRLLQCRFGWFDAYRRISFEQEAYQHQDEKGYLTKRKRFAWFQNLYKNPSSWKA